MYICHFPILQIKLRNALKCGPVHTSPEEFENGVFILKTHQIFSVHTTPEKFKNATITSLLVFVFEEKKHQAGKSQDYHRVIVFKEFRF